MPTFLPSVLGSAYRAANLACIAIVLTVCTSLTLQATAPTWTDGVACIVYSHCTPCHNDKGIAPFSLMRYEQVYQKRASIAAAVQDGHMPPFPASQTHQKYARANTLTAGEIEAVVSWVNNDAPVGDASNLPSPPVYSSAYEITNPDFVGTIPTYTVASDNDTYRVFVIPMNNAEQKMIQRIEVVPGNRSIVHHALIFVDTSDVPMKQDLSDPLPGYSAFGGTGSESSRLVCGYTPGQTAFTYTTGFGTTVLPKSYLVIQIHYPGGIRGEKDSTQVRIQYGAPTLRSVVTVPALNHATSLLNGPLFIPANTVKTFYSKVENKANRTLTAIMPHMHLLGRSIKAICVLPNKDTITLIDIPDWDFHWQYIYQFSKPLFIPAGSVIYGEATYDNTTNNPENPNNPPKDVSRGEGTEDEMMLIYMNLSNYQAGDTNIVVDTSAHYKHDVSCASTTDVNEDYASAISLITIDNGNALIVSGIDSPFTARFYSYEGKVVKTIDAVSQSAIHVSDLPSGVYYLQIRADTNNVVYKKYVKE